MFVLPPFAHRHIGLSPEDLHHISVELGFNSAEAVLERAIPVSIRDSLNNQGISEGLEALAAPVDEYTALEELHDIAHDNTSLKNMIGMGYYETKTPLVIQRNILENPAWYTAYTPYQPEISQGRLEALLNFQTLVSELTGQDVAGSSLLDEATAAAEAMTLMHRASKKNSNVLLVDEELFPQVIALIRTRALPLDIDVIVSDLDKPWPEEDFFGVITQFPGNSGRLIDVSRRIKKAHELGALIACGADLLALTLYTPPGELGADVCFGTTQRFGVPLGFGGPHAGYIAVKSAYSRQLPGRLVGVSIDEDNNTAYRLALQTREQHIRRDRATSNICTAQVLLAIIASMYASYHGAEGLQKIALRIHSLALLLAKELESNGFTVTHKNFFDTVLVETGKNTDRIIQSAVERGINLRRYDDNHLSIACDENTTELIIQHVLESFGITSTLDHVEKTDHDKIERKTPFLQHAAFTQHRTETQLLRYIRLLSDKDIALDRSMIPLGSCTMKLNATAEMIPITWKEFANIHPFAPAEQTRGYRALIAQLENWLASITGYDKVSIQPNAGSQGEYAGLLAVSQYHQSRNEGHRTICLIPSSAHGTNAASAAMAGMKVVVVRCRDNGDVDTGDLKEKIAQYHDTLSCIMLTYPSTHGIYEQEIREICEAVHNAGGQVYIDGANLNALVGLARPGKFGGDVSHLNLHKTFCIPHGGGGPGVGPVAAREHLAPYLPGHVLAPSCAPELSGTNTISAAPYGSASILPITWVYIRLMGAVGLHQASKAAILSANYIAHRLKDYYPILYTGENGLVAHECIIDLRTITKQTKVTVDDVAKRLADYGFHAPTMSFPVSGTLMIEPTESESFDELNQFCDALIAISQEIEEIRGGKWSVEDSPLRHAPHTAESLAGPWPYVYDRKKAAFPLGFSSVGARHKIWPASRRINGAHGDRNLICSCPPLEDN